MEHGILSSHEVSSRFNRRFFISSNEKWLTVLNYRERYQHLPIYTLRLPGTRLYVINSLDLIPTVQRQWRTLLFPPVSIKAAKAAMGASNAAIAILEHDMVTDKGFILGMVKATYPTMVCPSFSPQFPLFLGTPTSGYLNRPYSHWNH